MTIIFTQNYCIFSIAVQKNCSSVSDCAHARRPLFTSWWWLSSGEEISRKVLGLRIRVNFWEFLFLIWGIKVFGVLGASEEGE